jgi:outer membrane protein assembly factor BamA
MKLPSFAMLSVLPLLCCALPSTAQSFVPKAIQFNGDSDYSSAELAAAAGLTAGESLTNAKLNESTTQLLGTGLFEDVRYAYNDQLLAFQVIPAAAYPWRLENFPINLGKDLDDRLRARFPLYRGKVPASGALLNAVSDELQEELAARKIAASVTASLYADPGQSKITAISFSITSPDVQIGEIQLGVLSGSMASRVRLVASKLTGSPYSADNSAKQLEASLTDLYQQQGYLEAKVHATARPEPVVNAKGVHIPFTLAIDEGPQYKLGGVQFASDGIVAQAAFDKLRGQQPSPLPGTIASPEMLRKSCEFITREYHNKGYMHAQMIPTPTFDRAHGTVNFLITAQPGPQYTMGQLSVENVSAETRQMIATALNLPQGAPFNEGAVIGITTASNVNPDLQRFFAAESMYYTLNLHDDSHTVDVDFTPAKKN